MSTDKPERTPRIKRNTPADASALATHLEDLFDQVWRCEREWSFDDRLELSLKLQRRR